MKLINILNLIAKGELEEGTKISLQGKIYTFGKSDYSDEHMDLFRTDSDGEEQTLFENYYLSAVLECEVEIIDLEKTDADFMFKALGYEKWEYEYEIGYGGKKDIVFNKPRKDIIVGDLDDYYQPAATFTMAELKAINKKCQELGWE